MSGCNQGYVGKVRVPTTFVQKYTARAQLKPSGASRAGLRARETGGGRLGVSRLDGKEDEIRHFLELGVSKTAIAKITGVSRTTLYSFMTTRGLRLSR